MKRITIVKVGLVAMLSLSLASTGLGSGAGLQPPTAQAADRRVCPSGCTYSSIQAAVNAAQAGDVIKIAAGNYTYAGAAQVVYINKTITLRGGYNSSFTEPPDPVANPTILNGQGQRQVLYITGNCSPTIEGLRITGGNTTASGGGVYIYTAAAILNDNQVYNNNAQTYGGGIFLSGSPARLSRNIIYNNTSLAGAGLYLLSSTATLNENTISTNASIGSGGGLHLWESPATIHDNVFTSNTADHAGGGLYLGYSAATVSNNIITSNQVSGGATQDGGGGLYLFRSNATLINNVIMNNQATAPTNAKGGGIYILGSSPSLLHSTIVHNTGGDGSGICVTEATDVPLTYSTVGLTNTILVSHTIGITATALNLIHINGILWFGNGEDNLAIDVTVSHPITGNPAFAADGYHLTDSSAAINKGVSPGATLDIDGEPRFGTPDLGVDERWVEGALKRVYMPIVFKNAG